jgi:hypothetical protein
VIPRSKVAVARVELEVAEGGEEGTLLSLDILDVLLLEHLLAYLPLPELVHVGGVFIPVLALARVRLALELRAISDEVVGVPHPK